MLTTAQASKFCFGYNTKAQDWNYGVSDGGRCPFRAGSWSAIGYEAARDHIVKAQLAGQNVVIHSISQARAKEIYSASV